MSAGSRARMMRRRRRTVVVCLLSLGLTVAWLWPANRGDGPAAGAEPASAAQSGAAGGASVRRGAQAARPGSPGTTSAAGTGRLRVVPGTGPVAGTGPLRRYLVEVEEGLGDAAAAQDFAGFVDRTLSDSRSWIHGGGLALQRVDTGPVAFRVALAAPSTVDRYCAPLQTHGFTSCWNGRGRAVLNQIRWTTGVPWYARDLDTYRRYMVNHEVGHALGHHHELCPRAGAPAPAMQQQTLGMQGCRANAWPYP